MEDNRERNRQCIFCEKTNERNIMSQSTDCGDICIDCLFLTHRHCCECGYWRLKTIYNSSPDDPDYVMCDECVRRNQ